MSLHGFERNIPKENVESISIVYQGWGLNVYPNGVLVLNNWQNATALGNLSVCPAEALGVENVFDILYEKYAKSISVIHEEGNSNVCIQFMEFEQNLKYPLPSTKFVITPEIEALFQTALDMGIPFDRRDFFMNITQWPIAALKPPTEESMDRRWAGKESGAEIKEYNKIREAVSQIYEKRKTEYLKKKPVFPL